MVQMYSTRIQEPTTATVSRTAAVRIAECFEPHHTRFWDLLRQVGIDGAISELDFAEDRPWGYSAWRRMKSRYEAAGLELLGIDDYPPLDKARLGLPGAEAEIEDSGRWCATWAGSRSPCPRTTGCRSSTGCAPTRRTPPKAVPGCPAFRRADIADAGLTTAGRTSPEQTWKAWERFDRHRGARGGEVRGAARASSG